MFDFHDYVIMGGSVYLGPFLIGGFGNLESCNFFVYNPRKLTAGT